MPLPRTTDSASAIPIASCPIGRGARRGAEAAVGAVLSVLPAGVAVCVAERFSAEAATGVAVCVAVRFSAEAATGVTVRSVSRVAACGAVAAGAAAEACGDRFIGVRGR